MPGLDIHDETFVAVPPGVLRRAMVDAEVVSDWFPGLRSSVFMDRGDKGVRWSVSGDIDGSLEVWLEEVPRGTVVHWFVRGHNPPGASRGVNRRTATYRSTLNERMFSLKDEVEATLVTGS